MVLNVRQSSSAGTRWKASCCSTPSAPGLPLIKRSSGLRLERLVYGRGGFRDCDTGKELVAILPGQLPSRRINLKSGTALKAIYKVLRSPFRSWFAIDSIGKQEDLITMVALLVVLPLSLLPDCLLRMSGAVGTLCMLLTMAAWT